MSWPQWSQATGAVAGWSGTGVAPAAPAVAALQTPGTTYTPEQWAAMQQQNWQQWVQWQQQYQQWQQQYGEQYQKSLALAGQTTAGVPLMPVQPPLPIADPNSAPPLPSENRPPLPPEEPPRNAPATVTASSVSYNVSVPPPNVPPPPPQQQQEMQNLAGQNYGQNRYCNTSQPPPSLLSLPVSKPPFLDNPQPRNQNFRSEFPNKRPGEFGNDHNEDAKKNRWDGHTPEKHDPKHWNAPTEKYEQKQWNAPPEKHGQKQWNAPLEKHDQKQWNAPTEKLDQKQWNTPTEKHDQKLWNAPPEKLDQKPWNAPPEKHDQKQWNALPEKNDQKQWNTPPEKHDQKQWNANQTQQRNQQWSGNKSSGQRPNVEELSEAEKNFDKQFEQWEAQFNKWKEQNAGHPDKQQYKEYEAKWENWRAQLLDRREQMRRKRLGVLGSPAQATPSKSSTSTVGLPIGPINPPIAAVIPPQQVKLTSDSNINKEIPKQSPVTPATTTTTTNNKPGEDKLENSEKETISENDISILFSQPPKEQRTNIRLRRASIKSDTDSTADTSFLKSSTANEGGIPGLDLVKDDDNKLPDNKEYEKKPETESSLPDFEAISKGINSILGDEKLLNMLSMVAQNKKIEPLNSSGSQNTAPNSNNLMQDEYKNSYESNDSFKNQNVTTDQFGQNQYNRNYDQHIQNQREPNRDMVDRGPSVQNNLNDFRGPPNFNQSPNIFHQDPLNRGNDNFNKGAPNRDSNDFNKFSSNMGDFGTSNRTPHDFGPPNRGPNDFGPPNRGPNNFNPDNRGPNEFAPLNRPHNDFNQSPSNNFNRGPNNFNQGPPGRGPNFNKGPAEFNQGPPNRGPGDFNQGPSNRGGATNFNQPPPNRGSTEFNQGPINRGGPANFNQPPPRQGDFNRGGPGNFQQGPSNRGPGDFNQGHPNRGGPGNFNQAPLNRGPGDFNQGPLPPNRGPPNRGPADFSQGPPHRGAPEDFSQGPPNRGTPEDFSQGPPNRGAPEDFSQGPPNRGSSDFNQSLPNRGSGDCNQGPQNRGPRDFNQGPPNRGPGNFNQGPQNRRSGDFNQGPHRISDDFKQGSNRGPGDFNQGPGNRGSGNFNQGHPNRGSGDFNQGSENSGSTDFNHKSPNRGPDDFNQSQPNRGPGDFNQGQSNRGPGNFNQGQPNRGLGDFNQGQPNRGPGDFNQRPSNSGPNDFNRGPPNRGPNEFNQGPPNRNQNDFNKGPVNRGPGDFNHGPQNRGPGDFNQGPPNRGPGPNDMNQLPPNRGPNNFNQGPNWGPLNRHSEDFNGVPNRGPPGPGPDQRQSHFNRDQWNSNQRASEHSSEQESSNPNPISSNENEQTGQTELDCEDYDQNPENFDNSQDLGRNRPGRWSGDNFAGDRPFSDPSRFPNPNMNQSNTDQFYRGSNDKYWDEALILKPVTVVDYEHKSLNKPVSTFMEPVQTFDYGHTSKKVDKNINDVEPSRDLPTRFHRYSDPGSKFNRDFPPKPPTISSGSRDDNSVFQRKSFDNRRPLEKFNRFASKSSRHFEKPSENKMQYEDVDDFEDDPFEEPEFNRSSKDRELEPFLNKPNPDFDDSRPLKLEEKTSVTVIEDLLVPPGRNSRPPRIVIILRGPPGSGKTFLAKLIKDKEVEQGGSAPRILSLDDYFMVEQDKEIFDKETGRRTLAKDMIYEYEECMELAYRQSLERAFKKTITDGFFPFIILDCVNDKTKHFSDMWSFAKQNGFQVYVCQMELDVAACTKRNIHHRSEIEIERLVAGWEHTPSHYLSLDATSLIQAGCISDVEMEEVTELDDVEQDDENVEGHVISKWERMEPSGDKLARLDGISKPLRPRATMEDYLQLEDDIPENKPGEKRVRWADLEERRQQDKMRAIGFVVGQTDWDRMMDPTQGGSALTQTKYIERVRRF